MAKIGEIIPGEPHYPREVSMLFAAFRGGSQLSEPERVARLFGAACIAAGVVTIAAG